MNNPKNPFRLLIEVFVLASVLGSASACAGDELTSEDAKAWFDFHRQITGSKTFEAIASGIESLPNGDKSPTCHWVDSKDADIQSYKTKNKIDHPRDSETGFSRCSWVPNTTTQPPGGITIIFAKQSDQFIWAKKSISGPLNPLSTPDKTTVISIRENPDFFP